MKKNKFTPGPWVVDADGFIVERDTENHIYPLAKVFYENYHNAALIAEAPNLLVALESMLQLHLTHHNEPVHVAARIAIAKARWQS